MKKKVDKKKRILFTAPIQVCWYRLKGFEVNYHNGMAYFLTEPSGFAVLTRTIQELRETDDEHEHPSFHLAQRMLKTAERFND